MFNRKPGPDLPQPSGAGITEKQQAAETVIGSSASFKGTLKAEGNIRVDGTVEGEIESAGSIVISRTAKVIATITAQEVQVAGTVKGNVNATNRVEVLKDGRIWGDISTSRLLMDEGAFFHGASFMRSELQPPEKLLLETSSGTNNGTPAGGQVIS